LVAYKITGDVNLSIVDQNIAILTIFPNPAKESFKINYKNDTIKEVSLYNSLGQLVLTTTPENNTVDISTLSNGFYIVLLKTTEKEYFSKLIKE